MAKPPLDYHPAARAEAIDAFEWYRTRSTSAAERFRRQLDSAQIAIQESPRSWAAYLHGTRCYKLKRYPYLVVYHVGKTGIEIVAIAHGRRKPGYWTDRLSREP